MVWYEMLGYILGGSGIVGGVYTIFTMRVNKEGLIINNLKQIIDEVKANHNEYKIETDEKFDKLEKKISKMEIKEEIYKRATFQGYRCPFPQKGEECPVTKVLDSTCNYLNEINNKE